MQSYIWSSGTINIPRPKINDSALAITVRMCKHCCEVFWEQELRLEDGKTDLVVLAPHFHVYSSGNCQMLKYVKDIIKLQFLWIHTFQPQ